MTICIQSSKRQSIDVSEHFATQFHVMLSFATKICLFSGIQVPSCDMKWGGKGVEKGHFLMVLNVCRLILFHSVFHRTFKVLLKLFLVQ